MSSLLSFSPVSAKTILTDIPRSDWAKYGINPLKVDTDNDGFTDSEEIRNGFCPTSADSIALTDKNCRKGRFNSYSQIYTPPLGAHFITPRAIKKFSSCSDLERIVSASNTTTDYEGKARGQVENAEECKRIMAMFDKQIVSSCKIKQSELDKVKLAKKDWYFTAQEAKKLGMVHEVI